MSRMDARLMVISTRHNRGVARAGTQGEIKIDLQNAVTNIKDHAIGLSIESVSFDNIVWNVQAKSTLFKFDLAGVPGVADGPYEIQIEPHQYDGISFAAELQTKFNLHPAFAGFGFDIFTAHIADKENPHIANRLELQWLTDGGMTVQWVPGSLTFHMGLPRGYEFTLVQGVSEYLYPNLAGEPMYYIHSTALTAGRHSVAGHAIPDSVICSVPMTAPFGGIQTTQYDHNRPMILWDSQSPQNLESIDISLRDADRDPVNLLGSGELYITIRLWMRSR